MAIHLSAALCVSFGLARDHAVHHKHRHSKILPHVEWLHEKPVHRYRAENLPDR